jgi:hypothetical protein
MDIRARVASVKAVFTNRIMEELVAYFSAFAEIHSVILSATSQVAAFTLEAAKENSTTKMNLDVVVSNPMVVVPRSSFDKDNFLVIFLIPKFEIPIFFLKFVDFLNFCTATRFG